MDEEDEKVAYTLWDLQFRIWHIIENRPGDTSWKKEKTDDIINMVNWLRCILKPESRMAKLIPS